MPHEPLTDDDQRRIIRELKHEYRKMARIQKYVFIVFSAIASIACLWAGMATGLHPPFFLSALAFFLLIGCEIIQNLWWWVLSGSVQFAAAFTDWKYRESLTTTVWIGVHIIYAFLVVYWLSSHHFFTSFPEQIQNLNQLKHGTAKKKKE